jgi:hypothetical protein
MDPGIIKKLKFQGIKDYDVVHDEDVSDGINEGRFIYFNNILHKLEYKLYEEAS